MQARTTVLLDALGTLVALEPPAPLLRAELARRFALHVSEVQAAAAINAEIAYYRAHLDQARDTASLAALRRRCAGALRDALVLVLGGKSDLAGGPGVAGGLELARELDLAELTEALLASLRFRAFADAQPALAGARTRGLVLVVVSNWDVSLHDVLTRLGLTSWLDGVLTSAQAGSRKPAREIFEQALALAGARPEQALHVGDSLDEDVAGARAAGIEPVLLRRDGAGGPPGIGTIASLAELAALAP